MLSLDMIPQMLGFVMTASMLKAFLAALGIGGGLSFLKGYDRSRLQGKQIESTEKMGMAQIQSQALMNRELRQMSQKDRQAAMSMRSEDRQMATSERSADRAMQSQMMQMQLLATLLGGKRSQVSSGASASQMSMSELAGLL